MTYVRDIILLISILLYVVVTVKSQQNCSISYLMNRNTGISHEASCCHQGFVNWYYRHVTDQAPDYDDGGNPMYDDYSQDPSPNNRYQLLLEDTSKWNAICMRYSMAVSCAHIYVPECARVDAENIIRNLSVGFNFYPEATLVSRFNLKPYSLGGFYDSTCAGETVSAPIERLINDATVNTTCLTDVERVEFDRCTDNIKQELTTVKTDVAFNALRSYYERLTVEAYNCMRIVVERSSCSVATKGVFMHIARMYLPGRVNITSLNLTDFSQNDVTSALRCTVGVYGDPHLRLCREPRLITCSAPGLQNYLSNRFFSIFAVNELFGSNFNARATTIKRIIMTFRSHDGSQQIGQYVGENGILPQSFADTNATEIGEGLDKVTIIENSPYRVVMIQQALGAVIMVRRSRTNYFFTVRMAENVVNQSSGLLVSGCPESELIAIGSLIGNQFPQQRSTGAAVCRAACSDVSDMFRDSCEFDCQITGDIEFVNMTIQAEKDGAEVVTQDNALIKSAVNPLVIALPTVTSPTDATPTQKPKPSSASMAASSVILVFMSLFLLH